MNDSASHKHTNLLINESSPYLLQHAHNPVDWYPWGQEAFDKAKREDKPVLVSIGYSACHWCHVMEHESFMDEEVAGLMNRFFICIKVDREERPDVDHTYMDAVQLITGRGGWPLNCFTLPDGKPIFGGTYFPKDHWKQLLEKLHDLYLNDRDRVSRSAKEIMNGISSHGLSESLPVEGALDGDMIIRAVSRWKPKFDRRYGGNSGAPKFPMPVDLHFLLKYYLFTKDEETRNHLKLSLNKMADGGIYDQLGGGFARYSTDAEWKVPHFEKMLYDNAQLVNVYAAAYTIFQKQEYKNVVRETLEFMERELTAPEGVFYSALDADSEGEEGTFYVWQKKEIGAILGDNAEIFNTIYGITAEGNWEAGKNVLHRSMSREEVDEAFDMDSESLREVLAECRKKLFEVRGRRARPLTDDKVLTAWNALAISALVRAYRTFDDDRYLERALKAAHYFRDQCLDEEGAVTRMIRKVGNIPGFLDDHALLSRAYIDLYQATFDEVWLHAALRITDHTLHHFFDDSQGLFLFSDAGTGSTVTNKTEISDNVIPSSNSVMAGILYDLYLYYGKSDLRDISERMLRKVLPLLENNIIYFANWANLLADVIFKGSQVVFTGLRAQELRRDFDCRLPYALVAGSEKKSELPLLKERVVPGKSLIYVCEEGTCQIPVNSIEEALPLTPYRGRIST